jgi:hypothetical protein
VWEQQLFRVVNVGQYKFFDGDLAINFTGKFLKAGVNHTYQRPFNTNVSKTTETFQLYQIKDSVVNGDTVYGEYTGKAANGDSIFVPYYEKSKPVTVNLVKKSVTFDGKNFLNLPTNMTKLYLSITPFDWLSINTNLRMIWGITGRASVLTSTDTLVNPKGIPDTGNYSGYYGEKNDSGLKNYIMHQVSKKWNASLCFDLPSDMEASFYIYNILGTDRHDFTNKKTDPNTVNTLRAEQMFDYSNHDLYSVDQRTFGVTFTKNF